MQWPYTPSVTFLFGQVANVRRQVHGFRVETGLHFHCEKWTIVAGKRRSTSLQQTSDVDDEFFSHPTKMVFTLNF
jgi:hypothetical protein